LFEEEREMLNKKLVLGSLAGATLLVGAAIMLPSVAGAAVNGTCANCHTMHASDEGVTTTPSGFLLKAGCAGCHAIEVNSAAGVGATFGAPQVGDDTAGVNLLAGGYFNTTVDASGASAHSVIDASVPANLTVAPGDATAPFTFVAASTTNTNFECTDCHGAAGHHGTSTSYRFLQADLLNAGSATGPLVTGTGAAAWEVGATAPNVYDAASMNTFCSGCHSDFHGTTNTGGTGVTGSGPFTRHPTNVITSSYGASYTGATGADKTVATGDGGEVMCLSCHRAHGSDQPDMLRFTYANNSAGDGTQNVGCETCHGQK
jgi:hypothetical protein